MRHVQPDDLDPRRRPRHGQRRDWASISALVVVPRMRDLLATLLVRAGLVR